AVVLPRLALQLITLRKQRDELECHVRHSTSSLCLRSVMSWNAPAVVLPRLALQLITLRKQRDELECHV
ncbi:hypothetical protein PSZ55_23955, partial [Shigella sonnei]|nr:hypothetical protein [Shigella sonnei]